jgi:DNA mismatch endonuclease (patch repair protein)
MSGPQPSVSAKRSYIMSRVKSRDTGVEMLLRRALWRAGVRGYRLRWKLLGRPDLVFVGKRVVVFVDGCFWHGCRECKRAPKENASYWGPKIKGNRKRDRAVSASLTAEGWTVLRFWEHEVKNASKRCVAIVRRRLR